METLYIHPENPQQRLVAQAAAALERGEIVLTPTSCGYVAAVAADNKNTVARLMRTVPSGSLKTPFVAVKDIAHAAHFGTLDNELFRAFKSAKTPVLAILSLEKNTPLPCRTADKKVAVYYDTHPVWQMLAAQGTIVGGLHLTQDGESVTDAYTAETVYPNADVLLDCGISGTLEPLLLESV